MRPNVLELVEKINRLLQPAKFQHLTKLEADLLKDYLRSLYDVLDDPSFGTSPAKVTTAPPLHEIPPVVQSKPAEESLQPEDLLIEVNAPAADPVAAQETEKQQVQEPVAEPQKELVTEELPVVDLPPVKPAAPIKGSLNEAIKTTSSSLNEKLKTAGSEVNQKLAARPLKELIDFNKRHALITGLFKGDSNAFAQAIETLDKQQSYAQAEEYLLKNLAVTYHWTTEDQTTRMLVKLVKQRFGVA